MIIKVIRPHPLGNLKASSCVTIESEGSTWKKQDYSLLVFVRFFFSIVELYNISTKTGYIFAAATIIWWLIKGIVQNFWHMTYFPIIYDWLLWHKCSHVASLAYCLKTCFRGQFCLHGSLPDWWSHYKVLFPPTCVSPRSVNKALLFVSS